MYSCTNDIINSSVNNEFNEDCIDWFYNMDNESLFIQIDTKEIEHTHIDIKLSPLDTDFYTG